MQRLSVKKAHHRRKDTQNQSGQDSAVLQTKVTRPAEEGRDHSKVHEGQASLQSNLNNSEDKKRLCTPRCPHPPRQAEAGAAQAARARSRCQNTGAGQDLHPAVQVSAAAGGSCPEEHIEVVPTPDLQAPEDLRAELPHRDGVARPPPPESHEGLHGQEESPTDEAGRRAGQERHHDLEVHAWRARPLGS